MANLTGKIVRAYVSLLFFMASFATTGIASASTSDEQTIYHPAGRYFLLGESAYNFTGRYDYIGHSAVAANSDSQNNRYDAILHISKPIALLDPHLLRLDTGFDIKGEYATMTNSALPESKSNSYGYQYAVNGSAFDKKWYPIAFHANSSTDTITPAMAQAYDNKSTSMGASITLVGNHFCSADGRILTPKVNAKANRIITYSSMVKVLNEGRNQYTPVDSFTLDTIRASRYDNIMPVLLQEDFVTDNGFDLLGAIVCGMHARLGIERTTQETTGGADYKGQTTTATGNVMHTYGNITVTNVDFSYMTQTTESGSGSDSTQQQNSGFNLTARNNLKKDDLVSLDSNFQFQDMTAAGIPSLNLNLDEILEYQITPASTLTLDYTFGYSDTAGTDGTSDQSSSSHSISTELQNRIGPFIGRIRGRYNLSDFTGGTDQRYAVLTGLAYRKAIASSGQFSVGIDGEHEIADHHAEATTQIIRDELHAGVHQNDILIINNFQPVASVTKIMSKAPDIIYVEGIDYSVDLTSGRITILPTGTIDPSGNGMDIFITYTVPVNPSSRYETDTVTVSTGLSLMNGKINFAATWTKQVESPLSGQPTGLYNTEVASAKVQAQIWTGHTFGVEYRYNETGPTLYRYVEGAWQSRFIPSESSAVSLELKDRYTVTGTVSSVPGSTENTATATASYSQRITSHMQGNIIVNAVDDRREGMKADFAYLKAALNARWNKLQVNVTAQTSWRINQQAVTRSQTRDDAIRVEFIRYF